METIKVENITIENIDSSTVKELQDLLLEFSVHNSKVSKYFQGIYPINTIDKRIAKIIKDVINGVRLLNIIRINKSIVAFALYYIYKQRTHITDKAGILEILFVTEKERKKGYGHLLMENVMEYLAGKGIQDINIRIVHGNDEAKSFFASYGFQTEYELITTYNREKIE